MNSNPVGSKIQTQEAIPGILLYSTLALLPVIMGFVFYNLLAFGEVGAVSAILMTFLVLNFVFCFFWGRVRPSVFKTWIINFSVSIQWSYIGIKVLSVVNQWAVSSHVTLFLLMCSVSVFGIHLSFKLKERNLWIPITFSICGVSTLISLIWNGLGAWTMSAHAHALKDRSAHVSSEEGPDALQNKQTSDRIKNVKDHWRYSGETGPDMWSSLHDDFKTCSNGIEQSPIDIPKRTQTINRDVKFEWDQDSGVIIHDARSIQVSMNGKSKVQIAGRYYILKNFHFHTPSEHQVAGMSYPMEVHFAMESTDGKKAMIGLFVDIGKTHEEFGKILANLPNKSGSSLVETGILNLSALLPKDTAVYRYRGSETTPPCSEEILWSVLAETVEFSIDQVNAFRKLIPFNARPIQPIGNRSFESSIAH